MSPEPIKRLSACMLVLAGMAGCGGKSTHHHHHADDDPAAVVPPPPVMPPSPPPAEQTREQFVALLEPQLAAKICGRLNVAQVKQKLVLAIAMPADESNPLAQPLMDRLKADPSVASDFEIVPSFSAATDALPPGLTQTPGEVAPDGSHPQQTVYNPDDIYVLSVRYTETRGADGSLTLAARCRLTHPQSRELVLQISQTARQNWDGSAWSLKP